MCPCACDGTLLDGKSIFLAVLLQASQGCPAIWRALRDPVVDAWGTVHVRLFTDHIDRLAQPDLAARHEANRVAKNFTDFLSSICCRVGALFDSYTVRYRTWPPNKRQETAAPEDPCEAADWLATWLKSRLPGAVMHSSIN